MNKHDRHILLQAQRVKYWEWSRCRFLEEMAESEEAKRRIKNIGELLRDIHQNGYRI
jgi:hypothetical protein